MTDFDVNYKKLNHILVLDDIRDPGNLGTIIRSSLGFDIDLIILSNNSVDVYNSKVLRSTQGAIFSVPIIYRDLNNELKVLKEAGIIVFGTALKGAIDIKKHIEANRYALVFGNEAHGVSKDVLLLCDQNLYIPINKKLESLNVGVSVGIALYEFNK